MIIDCHAHVIQNWASSCGHSSREIHMKYLQRGVAFTVARTIRARDGAKADTTSLSDPYDPSWNGLQDVAFRVGRFGQLEFTAGGEDYRIQYMPVGMQNLEAPPELMLAQMAYAGVDHAVLQAGGMYGAMTSYNAFAQLQYPARFTALMHVDEGRAGSPDILPEIDRAIALGIKGIYFNIEGFGRYGFTLGLDAAELEPFFAKLHEAGLVLCAEINGAPTYDKAGYLRNMRGLAAVLDRHRGLICHLAMGIPVSFFAGRDGWDLPGELEALYKRDDFCMEIMFPITWGGEWDYPYREAHPLIRDSRNRFGAEKLLWGSDMPNVERFCTYSQSLEYVRRYCDFLNSSEMDRILGGNAVRLYRIATDEHCADAGASAPKI